MTYEHLRPLLSSRSDLVVLHKLGERFARAQVPQPIVDAIRMGRVTALRKRDGGVRGIVAGDVFRRLVARTIAKQLGEEVESATSPFQYALSPRAGCECVAHVLQGICELDPTTTITSIDGISAFDLVSRRAMLSGLHRLEMGNRALPFVRMFYGDPSSYWWEDDGGVSHRIRQGEGGEQGDALMPLLFALGQHAALEAVQRQLRVGERLFAYHDDIYVVSPPDRVGAIYAILQHELFTHAGIRVHGGKTQVWNMAGIRPAACDVLEQIAQAADPTAVVWRGSDVPTRDQDTGSTVGPPGLCFRPLERTIAEHAVLLERIPLVPDVQSAWLLLVHCAQARATYLLRSLQPSLSEEFARSHDSGMWGCLCSILQLPVDQCDEGVRHTAALPLVLGGLGLRNAEAHQVRRFLGELGRHPDVAIQLTLHLEGLPDTPCLSEVAAIPVTLSGVGLEVPTWRELMLGARAPPREPDDHEPGSQRAGWQHEAASRVDRHFRDDVLFAALPSSMRALIRSQAGPMGGMALSATPTSMLTRIEPHLFRIVLLRRLRQPLPLSARSCRCGRLLDILGHHRAACARAGFLGQRGFAIESVVARYLSGGRRQSAHQRHGPGP